MKIKDLIKVFEQLLPIYKKAYKEDWVNSILLNKHLNFGICTAADENLGINIFDVMSVRTGYYKNYIKVDFYRSPCFLFPLPKTGKDLKSRIDFMESEIVDLKRLLKKGFTHV